MTCANDGGQRTHGPFALVVLRPAQVHAPAARRRLRPAAAYWGRARRSARPIANPRGKIVVSVLCCCRFQVVIATGAAGLPVEPFVRRCGPSFLSPPSTESSSSDVLPATYRKG